MYYFIKEQEWKHIFEVLSNRPDIRSRNEVKLRRFIEAVWYIARSGCQWRLLPSTYGSWRAVHRRFKNWSNKGIWEDLFLKIRPQPTMETVMVDATISRAHACSAGYGQESQPQEALGRSRGGFSTKIHALVDIHGNPLKFILTPGQRHEITQAEALVEKISQSTVIGDKGYDSDAFLEILKAKKCIPVIPPNRTRRIAREYDIHLYKKRHVIECFFGKIKHFRRVFVRFDKTAAAYLSFLYFVAIFIAFR